MLLVAGVLVLLWYHFLLEINWQNILIKLGFIVLFTVSLYVFKIIGKPELRYLKLAAIRLKALPSRSD